MVLLWFIDFMPHVPRLLKYNIQQKETMNTKNNYGGYIDYDHIWMTGESALLSTRILMTGGQQDFMPSREKETKKKKER